MLSVRPFQVLIARCAFPDLDIERQTLAQVGAEIVDGRQATDEELELACRHSAAIITDYFPIRRRLIEQMQECRVICQYGVGLDQIDVAAATEKGILVTHTPDYCTDEVADHALALLLCLWRKIVPLRESVLRGRWEYIDAQPLHRIRGRVLGLIGFGRIARALATRAQTLGFTVLAHDPLISPSAAWVEGVELAELTTVLARADAISLHVPLTPATSHLLGSQELSLLKPTAFLVNTSRGGLIDQRALTVALERGQLGGAALDVLEEEPPDYGDPLLKMANVIVTPHAAFYSNESMNDVQTQAAEAVAAVLSGEVPRVVANPLALESARSGNKTGEKELR